MMSNGTSPNESRRNSQSNQAVYAGRYDDYMQDVPIELFTISRMSLNTHNSMVQQDITDNRH